MKVLKLDLWKWAKFYSQNFLCLLNFLFVIFFISFFFYLFFVLCGKFLYHPVILDAWCVKNFYDNRQAFFMMAERKHSKACGGWWCCKETRSLYEISKRLD